MLSTANTLTPNQIADCRTDLLTFARTMFLARKGTELKYNSHQRIICDALEKVVIGKIPRLIINVPPRSGKTELAVINFIAWCMGNWPDSEFIHASYSKRLATNNTYQARAIMQHEVYSDVFTRVQFMMDSNAKDEFRTNQGGIVYASGTDGTITGYGGGKMRQSFGGALIVDDPHKAGEANSQTMRENVINWFSQTLESRKNAPHTPIIIIMQRLHDDDLSGFLLKGGNGEKWHHINIPALSDDGESFWPEQFPAQDLLRMAASDSFRFTSQYLQRPTVLGGNIIKGEWFKRAAQPPKIKHRKIFADTAMKTGERNDYSVLECWGLGEDGKIYLLDLLRGKWEAPDLKRRVIEFWNKHNTPAMNQLHGRLRQLVVEDKASGTGLIQDLKRPEAGRTAIPVAGVERTKDKLTRVMDVLSFIEAGYVVLLEDSPFLSDFITECESFTADDSHVHDDQIDPMCDAIEDMLRVGTDSFFGRGRL